MELNQSVETVVHPAVEDVLRDLHSTHLAEKQCLAVDIQTYQRVIRRLVCKLKALTREFNKQQITVALGQKAQTQLSQLQTRHLSLHEEHQRLAARFEKTKRVLVEYERDRWKLLCQNEEVISELVSENESLRQMLLLSTDSQQIDAQLTYQESEQRAQQTKQERLEEMAQLRKPVAEEPVSFKLPVANRLSSTKYDLNKTLGEAAKLREMLSGGSLGDDLAGLRESEDDLDDLDDMAEEGEEDPQNSESPFSSAQPSQQEIQRMI